MSHDLYRVGKRTGQDRYQVKQAPGWRVVHQCASLEEAAAWLPTQGVDISAVPVLQRTDGCEGWPMLSACLKPNPENAIDRAAAAIQTLRANSELLADASNNMLDWFQAMEQAYQVLRATDTSEELRRLHDRLQRLRDLRNQMELGSYQIEVSREIGEAYRRLP